MSAVENRREFTRLAVPLEAELFLNSLILTGTVGDLSMSGCHMQCDGTSSVGAEGAINLFFPGRREEMQIEASGRVVRSDANGIAIEFSGVSLESYYNLRELLLANANDSCQMEEELVSHAGIKKRS